jgi:hypothetical protein
MAIRSGNVLSCACSFLGRGLTVTSRIHTLECISSYEPDSYERKWSKQESYLLPFMRDLPLVQSLGGFYVDTPRFPKQSMDSLPLTKRDSEGLGKLS